MVLPLLPPEIISNILVYIDNFLLACKLGDTYVTNKLYNPEKDRRCTWYVAITRGHLEIVKWLYINKKISCCDELIIIAVIYNQFKIVKWLIIQKKCSITAMDYAVRYGKMTMVKWLHYNRKERLTNDAMVYAAEKGSIEIVKWLSDNRLKSYNTYAIYWEYKNQYATLYIAQDLKK